MYQFFITMLYQILLILCNYKIGINYDIIKFISGNDCKRNS
jgi:hypothetical protein